MTPPEFTRLVASLESKEQVVRETTTFLSERGLLYAEPLQNLAVSLAGTQNEDCVFALIYAGARIGQLSK